MSCSALADFSGTDSTRLKSILDNVIDIASVNSVWIPEIADILTTINGRLLSESHGPAYWARYTYQKGLTSDSGNTAGNLLENIKSYTNTIKSDVSTIKSDTSTIKSYTNTIKSDTSTIKTKTSAIFDILSAEKDKQEDALSDYSSSGGKSASDTSSDVGAISGSLSSSFNSGVSASSALNAVDDNSDTFEYFFFGMHDDLNTASGGALRAPARGSSGSSVPDFLHDYWEGLG